MSTEASVPKDATVWDRHHKPTSFKIKFQSFFFSFLSWISYIRRPTRYRRVISGHSPTPVSTATRNTHTFYEKCSISPERQWRKLNCEWGRLFCYCPWFVVYWHTDFKGRVKMRLSINNFSCSTYAFYRSVCFSWNITYLNRIWIVMLRLERVVFCVRHLCCDVQTPWISITDRIHLDMDSIMDRTRKWDGTILLLIQFTLIAGFICIYVFLFSWTLVRLLFIQRRIWEGLM